MATIYAINETMLEMKEELFKLVNTNNYPLKLLDLNKARFDLLEKFVYETIVFHIKQLSLIDKNIELDINKYYIEFWNKTKVYKDSINILHVDCDEEKRKAKNEYSHPILSCVTYFDDSEFPVLLTDITRDEYMFKEFENKPKNQIIFPKKYHQIVFDGSKYHGVSDILNIFNNENDIQSYDRNIIAINLWNAKPTNISYYESENSSIYNKEECYFYFSLGNNDISKLNLTNPFTFDFYETIFYNTANFKFPDEITEFVKTDYAKGKYNFLLIYEEKTITNYKCKKLENDIDFMNKLNDNCDDKGSINNIVYNRFIQRYVYQNIYSKNVCEWIIFEAEKYAKNNGGWTVTRHKNYPTTDLPVLKIGAISNFILLSFNSIFSRIKNSYSLTSNIEFNIKDLFIVKYSTEMQNELEIHNDGSFLSTNILLSSPNDFEGGGTYFADGTTTLLEQGDLLVHSGQIKHSGVKITKGTRYILVAFVSVIVNQD